MKKILKVLIIVFLLNYGFVYAADFIVPNSSGEPIVVDVSGLNLISGIDVTIGDFGNQPRSYRDSNTKSLVIFPAANSNTEKTLEIRAGSSSITKTISFRPSPSGILKNSTLPSLMQARAGNSTVKISDGRIILAGGSKGLAEDPIDTIEVFDPETGKSDSLKTPNGLKNSKLRIPRSQHSATYLGITESPLGMITGPVEQILLTGGFSTNGLLENSLEIIEIRVGTNEMVSTLLSGSKSKLKKARIFHTASLLPDGRVLIVGGQGLINMTAIGALNSIELFDPVTSTIQASGISLNVPRLLHTATTLQNGSILITGGFTNEQQSRFGFGPGTEVAELVEVSNLIIRQVGNLVNNEGLGGHSTVLLTNGLVVVTGGSSDFFSSRTKDDVKGVTKNTIQFYNPQSETFSVISSNSGGNSVLQTARFLHQSILLPNGNIVVIGGLNINAGLNTTTLISSPVSSIEVIEPNLLTFTGNSLKAELKTTLETTTGRILPTASLITPRNKTFGFLSAFDLNNFTNCGVYITGGFTNGLGKLPTKVSEFLQVESTNTIEGRQIKISPEALIRGSYLEQLIVNLDTFKKIPALKVEPQTINLSASNNFSASIMVFSTNNEIILLKAQVSDPNGSIIVSPSLFQVGETVTLSRKDSSATGEFEVSFLPTEASKDFIPARIKINVSNSSKPFLATVPGFGLSLNSQNDNTSENIKVKVLSQDGATEFSSIPLNTNITATILDPTIANLGGTGISSVIGTLATQFTVNATKPGKTSLNFSINFPDVLTVSIPVEVTGSPSFSNTPIDSSVLSSLTASGIEFSGVNKLNSNSVSIGDLRLNSNAELFPIYVPINLLSSIDNSSVAGLFTIRPVFGVDLFTSLPRTIVNRTSTNFKNPLTTEPISIGGIVPSDSSIEPVAILASSDGLRITHYSASVSKNLDEPINMISGLSDVKDLKLFEFGGQIKSTKIAAVKGAMLFVLSAESGDQETFADLSGLGLEQELASIDNQTASVISVGTSGVDLVFPITDVEPRVVNFQLPGITKNISVVEKLSSQTGPFVIAYDGSSTISIVNLVDVNASVRSINTEGEKIKKIDYAGRFTVNGMLTDVLIASTQREILLFDLNNLTSIPVSEELKIKTSIEDLLVIDGVAYLALGSNGILALNIGALIDSTNETSAEIAHFRKNILTVIKPTGREAILTRTLNVSKLADSKPFLLASGKENNLTVLRVSP